MVFFFTTLMCAVTLITAWRVHIIVTRTILACWLAIMVVLGVLQLASALQFGAVGETYNALDFVFMIVAGVVVGLGVRWANGNLPDGDPLAPPVPETPPVYASADTGTQTYRAQAASVIGMQATPPPAKGGWL